MEKGLSLKEIWGAVTPFGSMLLKSNPGSLTREEVGEALREAGVNAEVRGSSAFGFSVLAKKGAEAGTDEWTHWKYGPEGNATSKDIKVAPPTHVKWLSGNEDIGGIGPSTKPGWRFLNGNAIYVWNKADEELNPGGRVNQLVMRDAYNGTLKWVKEGIWSNLDWMPLVFINDKIYMFPKSEDRNERLEKRANINWDKEIIALNTEGKEVLKWNLPDKFKPDVSPLTKYWGRKGNMDRFVELIVVNGKMIVTLGNHIIALNPEKSDEILWSVSLPQNKWAFAAVASSEENKLFFVVSDITRHFPGGARWLGSYGHDDIRAIDLADGSEVWKMNRWGEPVTDSLYGVGQLVYNEGKLFTFISMGISLAADDNFYSHVKAGRLKKDAPYTAMFGAIDTKTGSPLWMKNWGKEIPYWKGEDNNGRNRRPWANNALHWNGNFIEYRNGAYTEYEPQSGKSTRVALDRHVVAERLGIGKDAYNPSSNNRCARATAAGNYILAGYVSWYDKSRNYDFKPVRRAGCASHVYPAYGMTFYSPSGCGCYTMVNSKKAGLGSGSSSRGGRGLGFIALGNSGKVKVVQNDYRFDRESKLTRNDKEVITQYPAGTKPTSIRILRKQGVALGPILSDWPENKSSSDRRTS